MCVFGYATIFFVGDSLEAISKPGRFRNTIYFVSYPQIIVTHKYIQSQLASTNDIFNGISLKTILCVRLCLY